MSFQIMPLFIHLRWNISFLWHHIPMPLLVQYCSILQPLLLYCCYILVFIGSFDYGLTFLKITITCHLSLLSFILLVSLCSEKIILYSALNHQMFVTILLVAVHSFHKHSLYSIPKHEQKYYLDLKIYSPVGPYLIQTFIWQWTITKYSPDTFLYTIFTAMLLTLCFPFIPWECNARLATNF